MATERTAGQSAERAARQVAGRLRRLYGIVRGGARAKRAAAAESGGAATERRRGAAGARAAARSGGHGAHARARGSGAVERYTRPTRWFHAGVYVTLSVLLFTGYWLFFGREGDPSPLSELFGEADTTLHKWVGYVLTGLLVAGFLIGFRAVWTFVKESVLFRAGDVRWFRAWPSALFTGRFSRHEGHFDPGQRIMNVLLTLSLAVCIGSGLGLITLHGGPTFAVLNKMHTWSTHAVILLIAGHVFVAAGLLPGYRGAWRSMHLGGRQRADVARRLWPGWLERHSGAQNAPGGEQDSEPAAGHRRDQREAE